MPRIILPCPGVLLLSEGGPQRSTHVDALEQIFI